MFSNLKTRNPKKSVFLNRELKHNYCISPGATSAPTKGNEKDRLTRCKICGFICDKERDVHLKDGSWAGLGVNIGIQRYGRGGDRYYGAKKQTVVRNVLLNFSFNNWSNGDDAAPDNWTLEATAGTNGSVNSEGTRTYGRLLVGNPF